VTIKHLRQLGCTRVELGLQATDDRILERVKRGHTVEQFRVAMASLREAGFKVDLHFMPDLPGSDPEHDLAMYREIFSDPGLKPDMIKIYPCTVVKNTELYDEFKRGEYIPYGNTPEMFEALIQMKLATPRYCRISRLIRDIPANEIEAGNIITNLRETLIREMKKRDLNCRCLRCREIGHIDAKTQKRLSGSAPIFFVDRYETIGGDEYFLSFEDKKRTAVFGFARLRLPAHSKKSKLNDAFPELKGCAFIRELHVYGQLIGIGEKNKDASQHKGLGKKLMGAAEKIATEKNFKKVAVISGVGVRGYYRKLGYRKVKTYMIKKLSSG
ncbi:MAG: tRNA uridine(34) 5-carboxymethylaminomethyl modification radical SAM/GNAT enzyme Elp3, partial [Patescibacteria group bacterium]